MSSGHKSIVKNGLSSARDIYNYVFPPISTLPIQLQKGPQGSPNITSGPLKIPLAMCMPNITFEKWMMICDEGCKEIVKSGIWQDGKWHKTRDFNKMVIRQHIDFEGFGYDFVAQCTSGTLTTNPH